MIEKRFLQGFVARTKENQSRGGCSCHKKRKKKAKKSCFPLPFHARNGTESPRFDHRLFSTTDSSIVPITIVGFSHP